MIRRIELLVYALRPIPVPELIVRRDCGAHTAVAKLISITVARNRTNLASRADALRIGIGYRAALTALATDDAPPKQHT
jgi:hypothetical protein